MAIEKPAGSGASEVIGDNWPTESEDDALALADDLMIKAVNLLENATPALLDPKNTIAEKNQGKMAEAALTKMGVHINENDMDATAWANDSGWITEYASAITAAKTAMAAAAESHEAIHNMPTKQIPNMPAATQEAKDANLSAARHEVQTAKSTLDTVKQQVMAGLEARKVPPNGTPAIKPPGGSTSAARNSFAGGQFSDFPGGPAAGAEGAAKQLTNPGSTDVGAGSGGSAPAVTSPSSTAGADLGGSSGAGAGGGAPADLGAGQGMNGSPMGMGMPQGMPAGMPQGMPQGMPGGGAGGGQTPGNDVAKTIGDTVGKLADSQKGQPISKAALDDLYGRQSDGAEPATNPDGGSKDTDGNSTSGKDDKKVGAKADGVHTTLQGPTANPYGAENTNPALNNPPAPHLNSPSPAAPTVTAAPQAAGAPITSLSADESGVTTPVSHTQQHPVSDANPLGGHGPGAPNSGSGSNAQSTQSPVLGPYAAGGTGLGPAPLPPQTASPMGGAGGGVAGLPASTAAAAATPIMGVTSVPAAVEKLTRGGNDTQSKARHADRLAGLAAEHLLAEMKLAAIVDSFTQAGWAGTNVALAVIMTEDTRGARLRYVLATADGLSVLPAGIRMPAGVELLGQEASLPFFWEQAGNRHAGQKLAAFTQQNPAAGQLVYLVSNDTRSAATLSGDIGATESVQTDAERKRLADTGRVLPAELTRSELLPPRIPTQQAAEFVDEFGKTWGLDRIDNLVQSAKIRLWAARWDRHRSADPKYPALLATYLYCEAREAINRGDAAEAAYSIDTALSIEPQRGAAAS
ncbi:hypothetical protein [Mycobacteroides abscessus]|uniref:hypothetical protein n=1 Tax=Mycobacteroides abscessus TaxID=36809 RepID=UPI00092CAE55|nr:hypothetical protein [Mycobacteroides abscessus]SIE17824.1 Uncharacterised protein [Mycobacteroides abscessus subsp. abscessus]